MTDNKPEAALEAGLKELAEIETAYRAARHKANMKLDELSPLLIGRQVTKRGHRWSITQVSIGVFGYVDCYAVRVSPKGKIGTRGYHIGGLKLEQWMDRT